MNYKKIIIVDDSVTSRMIIKRCFIIAGFSESFFIEAYDGLHAFSLLENGSIDLIVTDLNMPKMDGTSFVKKIKANDEFKNIPVLVITSLSNAEIDIELIKSGVIGIIKKPISPEQIINILGDQNG